MRETKSLRQTIRNSFIRYTFWLFGLILLVCFTGMGFYTNFIAADRLHEEGRQMMRGLEDEIGYYQGILLSLESEAVLAAYLEGAGNAPKVYEQLYSVFRGRSVKGTFYLLDARGNACLTNAYGKNAPDFSYSLADAPILRKMRENSHKTVCEAIRKPQDKHANWTMGRAIQANGEIVGFLVFTLHGQDLKRLVYGGGTRLFVLTDPYDTGIAASEEEIFDAMGKFRPYFAGGRAEVKEIPYMMETIVSERLPIKLYALYSLRSQQEILRLVLLFAFWIPAVLCLAGFMLSEKISRANTQSLIDFLKAVKTPDLGNLGYRICQQEEEELQLLADEYNQRMERIEQLIAEVQESNERQRIAEIKRLEEQFNPHFIFNVLESIKCMVLTGEDKNRTMYMIGALARLMRYGIQLESSKVLLREDIKYTEDYLSIQKERFGEQLSYRIVVDPAIETQPIPKLLLQPIVENSIKYGFEGKEFLSVEIRAERQGDWLYLIVQDSGDGIAPTMLENLKSMLESSGEAWQSAHIGLYNVQRRIRLTYAETAAGMSIQSHIGEGTTIVLKVPYRAAGGEDHV